MGPDLKTIRKWQKNKAPGSWEWRVFKPDAAEPFEDYLRQRRAEGGWNAAQLYREICGPGYLGKAKAFRHWRKVRLREGTPAPTSKAAPVASPWRPPSPRQAARPLTKDRDVLAQPDPEYVEALCNASPEITRAANLACRFQAMIQTRDSAALAGWLEETLMSPLASLARGLLRDVDAVRAALTLPWSSGPVEGKIIGILKEQEAGARTADVCRRHGISEATFYKWKAKYGGLEVSEAKRLKALEDENARLKKLLAEAMLDNAMLKGIASKNV